MKNTFLILAIAVSLFSCDSDGQKEDASNEVGNLNLVFENTVNDQHLTLATMSYTNASGESYVVNELKYIISNIELTRDNNSVFTIPVEDSYFVINEQGSTTVAITGIPAGDYTNISFGFGVDPTRYPIESGSMNFIPTAEEAGMLWTWSAGYKFLKFEGTYSPAVDIPDANPFQIHVGSHGANLDNYRQINLAIAKMVSAETSASQIITFDVAKIFDSTHTMSLLEKDDIQVDPVNAPRIAENVSTAFSIQ